MGPVDRTYSVPDNESERLQRLKDYYILDSPSEPSSDNLTRLAADVFQMPIAVIALIDEGRQWHKSYVGFDFEELDRTCSFCNDLVMNGVVMTINDASSDPRVKDNPLVTGEPYLRSYAGAPIKTDDGFTIGAFCVFDREPRNFTENEINILRGFAGEAMAQIDLRYENEERRQANLELQNEIKNYEEQLYEQAIQQEELLHRARNHFMQVKSTLSLQKANLTHEASIRALELAETRIHAFVSIYDQLNQAKQALTIDSKPYLESIARNIVELFENESLAITIEQDFADVELSSGNALKFGLVLNELMTNVYQHVFLPKLGSRLVLHFEADGTNRVLTVRDDGPGLSSENKNEGGLPTGLTLLRDLIEYDGKGSIHYREEDGAEFSVTLPESE